MVGYVSVWPITQQAAEGVESGAIGDDDIDVNCIPESISYPHRNWICTVIVVVPAEKDVRREIILKLLGYLRTIMDDNRPCQIYAHAVTPDGERFCRRTGFKFGFLAIPCLCCLSHE
jgi:hypothetical protein